MRWIFIGVVCLVVAAGDSLFSTPDFDVLCFIEQTVLKGGQVLCSTDDFFA